jgi:hypothetical protein
MRMQCMLVYTKLHKYLTAHICLIIIAKLRQKLKIRSDTAKMLQLFAVSTIAVRQAAVSSLLSFEFYNRMLCFVWGSLYSFANGFLK